MISHRDARKAGRVAQAMLKMVKLDLPTLRRAFHGQA